MLPTLSAQEFVAKWSKATLKERAAAQEHFIDLCRLVGHPTPAEADPSGQTFTFEAGATKQRGGQGWADVWKKNYFAWEYKGKDKDLDAAYQQLLQYRESLLNPPLLVVSDMEQILVHTNFTNTAKRVACIALDDLLAPQGLAQLRAVFYEPEAFRAPQTTEQVTRKAATEFARMAELMRRYGADPEPAAHFLIRLLFCLFAEDVGLLPKNLFTDLVQNTQRQPGAFAAQLRQLFRAMATGGWFGIHPIVHLDGRVFDEDTAFELDGASLSILANVSALDWSSIEPSILGTLFQRSLDPSLRAQLGAHYTSKEDILLIVEPVLMAPLRRRWQEVQAEALDLARRRDEAATARARAARQEELARLLAGFAYQIARVQVLDPACGSANFLYISLRLLLDLWKEVSVLASDLGLPQMMPLSEVSPSPAQLHGIEINSYAHELAQATIWIGYIQWLHENGYGLPEEPILKPLDNILHMDAILAYDEEGKPVEPEWPEADVIVSNPPFLGGQKMRAELGDRYVDDLHTLYADRIPGQSDLVCYWFEKARALIGAKKLNRAGLLATQGIRGGANRKVLERIKETGDIFWAQSDRDWILEGATVHVSMVGFDDGSESVRNLDDRPVERINADLTAQIDLTKAAQLEESRDICFQGPVKVGPFDIEATLAQAMLAQPNLHGLSNAEVIKPWMNASDITRRSRNMWIIDFGELSLEDAALFEAPFEYVRKHVKPLREGNKDRQRQTFWWRLGRSGSDLKEAKKDKNRIILTPRVSKHRLFVWVSARLLPDSGVVAIARDDDYFFGTLHSRVHELWARRQGTQLREAESGFRYTPSSTFETFPFPWPPGQEPVDDPRVQAIAQAARELVEKRDRWLHPEGATEKELQRRTLTNLYNQRPTWLDLAHRALDAAVLDAYGWPQDLGDEEILERLLALNLGRAASKGDST